MGKKQQDTEKFSKFNVIVFGGDGDLAFRKIYPAIFHRMLDGQIEEHFNVVGIVRKEVDRIALDAKVRQFLLTTDDQPATDAQWEAFNSKIAWIKADKPDTASYEELSVFLNKHNDYDHIFYFSTPSAAFGPISQTLKACGLINERTKVVLEKPLGNSLESSKQINEEIMRAFDEHQVYRIDHYLGKETVQNLMVLRFANNLFQRTWDSISIDNIQITVSESLGVEQRADYYDKSGALLDMVQNHLLQLLCLVAMEPPHIIEADEVRNEKLKVLKALRPMTKQAAITDTVKGQYTRGNVQGNEVSSYLEDIGKYNSKTETFVAIKTYIDNFRWKNVPFYLRTGKRMKKRYSEIVINFKEIAHNIFPSKEKLNNNKLIIRLQPEERIELVQMTKVPGPGGYRYKPIALKLDYMDSFKERLPEAYERLLMDVIRGNQTLFMRQDELQAAWHWIETVTDSWKQSNQPNVLYEAGTWGPGDLILEKGATWITKSWKD